MRLKLLSSMIASVSLLSAPVMAQTSASKLSVARASASVSGEDLGEGAGGIVAIALVVGIVAIGVLAATQDDEPESN